jgi:hypothetical protein
VKKISLLLFLILAGTICLAGQEEFSLASAQIFFTQGKILVPIQKLDTETLSSWFGAAPRLLDGTAIFETGVPGEALAFTPGDPLIEIQGIPYFTIRSGLVELYLGMSREMVVGLLGQASANEKGDLDYLLYRNIGPHFRLGFDADGALAAIRL